METPKCQQAGGQGVTKTTASKKKRTAPTPGARKSLRLDEQQMLALFSGLTTGGPKQAPVLVETPKTVDPMANLDKKKSRKLYEMLCEMTKKATYIKNAEVVRKIRGEMKEVYVAFMARQQEEIQELIKMKQDIEGKMARLPPSPPRRSPSPSRMGSASK